MRTSLLACLLLCSCSSNEEPTPLFSIFDSAADGDAVDDTSCEPECHFDCFGPRLQCNGGVVYERAVGPRPCCHGTDFGGIGEACGGAFPTFACPSKVCAVEGSTSDGSDPEALCAPLPDAGAPDAPTDVLDGESDAAADAASDTSTDG